jgi:hypothetical protein
MNTVMRTLGGVIGGQMGAVLLAAYVIPASGGIPSATGYVTAFAISAAAAFVGVIVAVFVTQPGLRRRGDPLEPRFGTVREP